jgi:hypothetical protein
LIRFRWEALFATQIHEDKPLVVRLSTSFTHPRPRGDVEATISVKVAERETCPELTTASRAIHHVTRFGVYSAITAPLIHIDRADVI